MNRLQTVHNTAGTPAYTQYVGYYGCWAYDSFGNRAAEIYQTASCPSPETSVPVAGNQITYNGSNQVLSVNQSGMPVNLSGSFYYDAAGNVTNDIANQYLYDGEGRLCAVETTATGGPAYTEYVYDAEGTRVAKAGMGSLACWTPNSSTFTPTASYALGLGGEQVAELNGSGGWVHTNIYTGKLLATYNGSTTYFDLNDWL
jgi:hypothetical protein